MKVSEIWAARFPDLVPPPNVDKESRQYQLALLAFATFYKGYVAALEQAVECVPAYSQYRTADWNRCREEMLSKLQWKIKEGP